MQKTTLNMVHRAAPLFSKCICSSLSSLRDSSQICFHPDPACTPCLCVSSPPPVCFRGIACSSKQGSLCRFSHVCSIHELIQSHSIIPTACLFGPSGLVTIHTCSTHTATRFLLPLQYQAGEKNVFHAQSCSYTILCFINVFVHVCVKYKKQDDLRSKLTFYLILIH